MSEQRIRELLDEVARPVPPPAPHLAGQAWRRARQTRHRRLAIAGAVATVVAVLVGIGSLLPSLQEVTAPASTLPGHTFVAVRATENGVPREMPKGELKLGFTKDGWAIVESECGVLAAQIRTDGGRLRIGAMEALGNGCRSADVMPQWAWEVLHSDPVYELDGDTLTLTSSQMRVEFVERGGDMPLERPAMITASPVPTAGQ